MNGGLQIAVDLEQGEIRFGSEQVRLLPVAGDVFCLNDARGPLVRALKFHERSALLSDAADKDVATLIADAALVSAGVATDEVRVAASLALAGGGEEAPSFPDCAEFVVQRFGWDEVRVGETMALLVDRLCGSMVQQDASGWKQIVFQKTDADLGSLISQMATNLAQRAVPQHTQPASETSERKKPQPASHQPSRSIERSGFGTPSASTSARESFKPAASVVPIKRAPFRVLALNTDRTKQAKGITPPTTIHKSDPVEFSVPEKDLFVTSPPQRRSMSMSMSTTTTMPETPLTTDFPAIPKPQTSRVNFSLAQAATMIEPFELHRPVASFPAWQPFTPSTPNAQPSSEPVRLSSSGFNAAETAPHATNDWLAELAQLLEAECDMRGIDP